MIESVLDSELMELGIHFKQKLVSLISYVVVDPNDPAFSDPTKPIGPVLPPEAAMNAPYPVRKTAKGYRRVVVSPKPVTIVEKREIKKLIDLGFIVICCGGGGIPVIREERTFAGVDAVIDKDLASARLAEEVGVDIFLIATDEPGAYFNYGREDQALLRTLSLSDAAALSAQGVFPPGSMAPKIEAAAAFVRHSGKRAVITGIDHIADAVQGEAGTEIVA
jgi:carbamate kinase